MEITLKVYRVKSMEDIESFLVKISKHNSIIAKESMKLSRKRIIDYFKRLKREKKINSIHRPRNKQMQKELDNLVLIKRELKNSIDKINTIF